MEMTGWIIFATQTVGYVGLCLIVPFAYVLRTGRFWLGVVIAWLMAAAFTFVSMWIGCYVNQHVSRELANYCFEGPHFVGSAFCGWWQGMIVCLPAWIIHRRRALGASRPERGSPMTGK